MSQVNVESGQGRSPPPFPLYFFPAFLRPYLELARVEKPNGFVLMLWPYVWGLTMAAYKTKMPLNGYWRSVINCVISAFILRASACTVNDIFDRRVDAAVARTKQRPIPSGRISVFAACLYLVALYSVGIAFNAATHRGLALWVAIFQLLPLFAIYPLMKRLIQWPSAWLGFAMNFGFLTAWIAITGYVDRALLTTGMASWWCWAVYCDTIYACQDIEDDVKTGVKSSAIFFGSWVRFNLWVIAAAFVILLAVAGVLNNQGWPFFALSVGGTTTHIVWQLSTVDLESPKSCWRAFNRNGYLGWPLWAGLMLDYVLA
ncbi:hypothetical protein AGABI2DRAFT_209373 [Agaricus bisporus var. bisporus H97]|uniref:hypothetical protein n=1 Tax=Agaricus bisporus var. bisporus (strain H97 / ATCC MYA-4626 / FGSC 10389) TaxID=936046 RepID=UPI00029F675D|nr:hypothetical protein AGABI2DRAFT_209373 [Agaricus bisporus var. bisporus H97]EKV43822.1 hypothetical protein AGABI2DRAFT_209373 [Agaricus bisporus var. bisporus H97]